MEQNTTDKRIQELVDRFGEIVNMIHDANVGAKKIAAELADIIVENATIKKDPAPEKKPGPIRISVNTKIEHAVSDFFNEIDRMIEDAHPKKKKPSKQDMVSHPSHYQGKIECIDAMEKEFGKTAVEWFCLLNAFKYEYRKGKKGSLEEDEKKRNWYINKFNSLRKSQKKSRILYSELVRLVEKYKR